MQCSDPARWSIRHKAMGSRRGTGRQPSAAAGIHNGLGVGCAGDDALRVHLYVTLRVQYMTEPRWRSDTPRGPRDVGGEGDLRRGMAEWVVKSALGHGDAVL
jgi:hypothetical protein